MSELSRLTDREINDLIIGITSKIALLSSQISDAQTHKEKSKGELDNIKERRTKRAKFLQGEVDRSLTQQIKRNKRNYLKMEMSRLDIPISIKKESISKLSIHISELKAEKTRYFGMLKIAKQHKANRKQ
jgi:hypothetical protein